MYPTHDVGTLWRSRRWRLLLNLIDRLPQDTWYHQEISQDVEHAMMLLEAQERAKAAGRTPPPSGASMRSWTPEVDMLAKVLDATRQVVHVIGVTQGGSKKKGPKPEPRPATAIETARLRRRQQRHDILVARMVPAQNRTRKQQPAEE